MYSERNPISVADGLAPADREKIAFRTICFVGSGDLFSEIVLRTVETGLDRVRALRMPDIATLHLVLQEQETDGPMGHLCAVVCDERNTGAMLALTERAPAVLTGIKQVIAFENDAFACDLLARRRARLVAEQISLLPMNLNLATWVNLLRLIGTGGHYLPPHLLALAASARLQDPGADAAPTGAPARPELLNPLTPREAEVLAMAAEGAANKVIAHALDLSEHTVKLHMHRVIAKLGVHNRTEASVWFHQHRLDA